MLGGALLVAAFAAVLIPVGHRTRRVEFAGGPAHAHEHVVPGGTVGEDTVVGDRVSGDRAE
jgi:hypothetical protein